MIGELVAVRIDDEGSSLRVTGLVAQEKNRREAWSFKVNKGASEQIAGYIAELEEARSNDAKA